MALTLLCPISFCYLQSTLICLLAENKMAVVLFLDLEMLVGGRLKQIKKIKLGAGNTTQQVRHSL